MRSLRALRADTPLEVWTLAGLGLAGAVAMGLSLLFPATGNAPVRLQTGMMIAALLGVVLLLRFRAYVRPWMLQLFIGSRSIALALMIGSVPLRSGATAVALLYIWSAIYAAVFFSRRATLAQVALMIASYGVATLLGRAPVGLSIWFVMSATIAVSAAVLNDLSIRLREQADCDALTGLLNRNGFMRAAERERAFADRRGTEVALAVIDLDDFKLVNDHGGHAAGDRLLVELASTWRASLRKGDLLARHGGDEFVVLLPDTTQAQADAVIDRLARSHPGRWTAGVVQWPQGETLGGAIGRADDLLYAAKTARAARMRAAVAA